MRISTNINFMTVPIHFLIKQEEAHKYEESETHQRISFWYLLMNLKNNYLSKKVLKWANKKQKNFNIQNVAFSEKGHRNMHVDIIIKISIT